jgi:hypothetical protein
MIQLPFIHDVEDTKARENFRYLQDALRLEPLISMNFKFFNKDLSGVGDHVIRHGLKFVPKDVVLTSINPSTAVVTFKPETFTKESVTVSITANCNLRFFLGSYEER